MNLQEDDGDLMEDMYGDDASALFLSRMSNLDTGTHPKQLRPFINNNTSGGGQGREEEDEDDDDDLLLERDLDVLQQTWKLSHESRGLWPRFYGTSI